MAVQAQYPSNVLLFNSNGQQQAKNMLGITGCPVLQPSSQPGGGGVGIEGRGGGFLLDQSHFLPPNNGAAGDVKNPSKRGREEATTTTTTTTTTSAANNNSNPFNLSLLNQHQNQNPNPHHPQQYSNHHHPHQIIELSQLQHHPNAVVSTGLKLSFGDQQQQQQIQQQQTHNSPVLISLFSDDLANHIRHQSEELNHFIHAQAEQLRRSIAEKRQRHYRTLLVAAEEAVTRRLREKEVDLDKAARRHADLEARAAQLGAESQAWQAKARAQEAQAALLQAQLQQAMLTAAANGGVVGAASKPPADRDKGCDAAEDAESAYNDPERVVETAPFMKPSQGTTNEPACRACRLRAATVVILPCRHLSVCVDCDGVVQACPVCLGLRNSSVEVYLT